jgi:hypothetical protein
MPKSYQHDIDHARDLLKLMTVRGSRKNIAIRKMVDDLLARVAVRMREEEAEHARTALVNSALRRGAAEFDDGPHLDAIDQTHIAVSGTSETMKRTIRGIL